MRKKIKYWLHGSAGLNLHFQTYDLNEAKQYADSFTSKATVSVEENGKSAWNGAPCKVFRRLYTNGK